MTKTRSDGKNRTYAHRLSSRYEDDEGNDSDHNAYLFGSNEWFGLTKYARARQTNKISAKLK